jgi:PII-like signaling protein
MTLAGEQVLLRIYLRSGDRAPLTPTHELILKAARQSKLAGATVLRGIHGFGSRGEIRSFTFSLVQHVPVIVEIVDAPGKISGFIEGPMDGLMTGGTATLERAAVMMYRHRKHETPVHLRLADALKPLSTLPQLQPRGHMTASQEGVLLRIFIGEDDRSDGGRPLHEAILSRARELGLAGATVLRGSEGFGAHSVVHKASLLEMSADLPIVIEMVDSQASINKLLPYLETVVREGMITMEYVTILLYRHGQAQPQQST